MKSGIVSMILAMAAALNPVQNQAGPANIDQSRYIAMEKTAFMDGTSMMSPYDISTVTGSSITVTGGSIAVTGSSIISQDTEGDDSQSSGADSKDQAESHDQDEDGGDAEGKKMSDEDNDQKKSRPAKKKSKMKKKAPKKDLHTKYANQGETLTKSAGVFYGPCGKETYYNMKMDGVVSVMRSRGNTDKYWVRKDGVKMLGDYIMVAASLDKYDRGDIVETSLGKGIVCDTGGFARKNRNQFDIAVTW